MASKTTLVTFDFDWSFADQDTDRFVLEVLEPKLRIQLSKDKATMQYTDAVAKSCVGLHEAGHSREELERALQILPVHPAMPRGVAALKARGKTEFLCLSNSNLVYITTILEHHKLVGLFDNIITNPAAFQSSGLLEVRRRIAPDAKQHGCTVGCSANMCKGEELDAYINARGGWDAWEKVVYVGDGSNDYCPLLRLRSQDLALVRTRRDLEKVLVLEAAKKEKGELGAYTKCEIKYWDGAWEVEKYLGELP